MKRPALLAICILLACGDPSAPAPTSGRRSGFSPISAQGAAPVTSFAGVIDPTNLAFAGGLVACQAGCSPAVGDQNRLAFKAAADYAASHAVTMYVPPGEYPLTCTPSASYAVDLGGDSNLTIEAHNVTLRLQGNLASSSCDILWLRNASHVKLTGLTFSQRDITNATTATNMIRVGDGGSTSVDDVLLRDISFVEGIGGDCVRLDGGTSSVTVQRVNITQGSRFQGCAASGLHVLPGVARVSLTYDWFLANGGRDVWFDPTGNGTIGQFSISGNTFDRTGATGATSVELSGFGGAHPSDVSTFKYNRVLGGRLVATQAQRLWIVDNAITYASSGSSSAVVDVSASADVWIADNYVMRDAGADDGAVIKAVTSAVVWVRGNRVLQYAGASPGIDLSGTSRFRATENNVTYHGTVADSGATGFAGLYCAGSSTVPCSGAIVQNRVKRDDTSVKASLALSGLTSAHMTTQIQSVRRGTVGNTYTLAFVADGTTKGGSLTLAGTATTIHFKPSLSTVADVELLFTTSTLIETKVAGTGSTVLVSGDAFGATALTGGAQAARMLAGLEVLAGSGTTVGALVVRDNFIDGARAVHYVDATGSSAYPEGFPLISGDVAINFTNEIEGGLATYRTETLSEAESITSGAANPFKRTTFVSTTNTVAYSLADAAQDGMQHCFKIKAVTGSPAGTMTPAHLADGTTHTITWSAVGGSFCLLWDATGATYRVSASTGVTIN